MGDATNLNYPRMSTLTDHEFDLDLRAEDEEVLDDELDIEEDEEEVMDDDIPEGV